MKNTLILFFLCFAFNLSAQTSTEEPTQSIDGIVNEVLDMISGEAGKERDWDAFRSLFLPEATFTVIFNNEKARQPYQTIPLEKFIELAGPQYKQKGFLEKELHKVVDEYNGLANVFQTFYAKELDTGKEERGINSYQLVYFDDRWWIHSIVWTLETEESALPEKYLGN